MAILTIGTALGQDETNHSEHHDAGAQAQQNASTAMPQLETELDFVRHMILHHQEAVESARAIQGITEREEIRQLAGEIIEVQTREIETLQGWLEQWYPGETLEVVYQPMMRALEGLSPDEADRAFIEDMIEHHRMAVMNAQQLLARGLAEHDEVAAMARDIVDVQTREIAELQNWLRTWFGEDGAQGMAGMTGQMVGQGTMTPEMMSQMMGQGMMSPGMMGMHEMMRQCMGMMHQGITAQSDMPMPGMMDQGRGMTPRYDQRAAQALARAFLAGYRQGAEITSVEPPQTLYRVSFQDDDSEEVLIVDATTGEVRLEQSE